MEKKGIKMLLSSIAAALCLSGISYAGEAEIDEIMAGMTLEEKIGQMMVPSFRIWKEVPDASSDELVRAVENAEKEAPAVNITELNDTIREGLAEYHFGGTVFFAENCHDAEQTLKLAADLQTANREGSRIPLIISIDQEGGNVARLGFGTSGISSMALRATGEPENARKMGAITGEELALLGINADFAPVMDVNNNPNNPVIGIRSFADDPEEVATYGTAFLEGLKENGIMATLKHFPGHGNTDTDSHTGFPVVESTYEELKACELIPFQAAIDAGVDMIMTAHIQYPNVETETYMAKTGEEVYLPATMSRTILTDILRGDMGFEGIIVTDALDMAAISEYFETEDVLRMTINAGADMLLLPIVVDTASYRKNLDMVDMAVRLAREGRIDMACVDDAVKRILTVKQKYGLLDQTDFAVTEEKIEAAVSLVGSASHKEAAWQMAEQALTLVKNEDHAFPISMKNGEKTLIVLGDTLASRAALGDFLQKLLEEKELLPEGAEVMTMLNTADNEAACQEEARSADHVILVHRTYGSSCLDPGNSDGFSTGVFDRIIAQCHEDGKPVIVVTAQLPYDAARFTEADAILLAYCSSVMRTVPAESGAGSAYVPNLPAALCACFGASIPAGELPVNIPKLDENYHITDEILFARGAIH